MIRTSQKIKMIKISEILPNPYQTRRTFEKGELESLSKSFKEVGILSPVILRRGALGYETVCGQRRIRAAVLADLKEVPALIISAGDAQCAEISLIENIHRKNLSVFEEAEGYYNLMAYHHVKKEKLLKALSLSALKLAERIRFLRLDEAIRHKIEAEKLDVKYIKELIRLHSGEKQLEILNEIQKEGLSPKDVKELVNKSLADSRRIKILREEAKTSHEKKAERTPLIVNTVNKTVEILKNNGAKVEFTQTEDENSIEFVIKAYK